MAANPQSAFLSTTPFHPSLSQMAARQFNEERRVQPGFDASKADSLFARGLSKVENKLKDTRDSLDWETIKRSPQKLKQKTKLVSYTVDEEFNALHEQFCAKIKGLKSLVSHTTAYVELVSRLLDHSREIAAAASDLFDPCFSLLHETKIEIRKQMKKVDLKSLEYVFPSTSAKARFEEEYRIWDDTRLYTSTVGNIDMAVMCELQWLASTVSGKVDQVLKYAATIEKHIRTRSHILLDYDTAYNVVDTLALKQKTEELSIKQSRQYYNSERKLDALLEDYNKINTALKEELPYFFKLLAAFIQPLHIMTYYVNLMVTYQFSTNILSLQEEFGISVEDLQSADFGAILERERLARVLLATDILETLTITQFRKSYFDSLTRSEVQPVSAVVSNFDPTAQYCKALFNFKGVEDGDLPFNGGDIIKVLDDSGSWWRGKLGAKTGTFPSNYVERCL